MSDKKSGKSGYVEVDGDRHDVETWDIDPQVGERETSDTGSEGYFDSINTIKSCSGSFKATWDNDAKPCPTFSPGTEVELKLYIEEGGVYHHFPRAVCQGLPVALDAKGGITFTVNFKSRGPFTLAGE